MESIPPFTQPFQGEHVAPLMPFTVLCKSYRVETGATVVVFFQERRGVVTTTLVKVLKANPAAMTKNVCNLGRQQEIHNFFLLQEEK